MIPSTGAQYPTDAQRLRKRLRDRSNYARKKDSINQRRRGAYSTNKDAINDRRRAIHSRHHPAVSSRRRARRAATFAANRSAFDDIVRGRDDQSRHRR